MSLLRGEELHRHPQHIISRHPVLSHLTCHLFFRCLHTEDEYFLRSMKEAIHEILTDLSDSFSHMIDMALANEIQVRTSPTVDIEN